MHRAADALPRAVRRDLDDRRDQSLARALRRQYRSDLPFAGVPIHTVVRLLVSSLADPALSPSDHESWEDAIRNLWSVDPTHESRYAAIALARHPRYRAYASSPRATSLYRDLVTDDPTPETADAVAHFCLPLPLSAAPETEVPVMRSWAVVDSEWLRRSAILSQVRRRHAIDRDLLKACVGANLLERHAVVRDAIPEALAAYARTRTPACPWLRATLDGWKTQMPASLARAVHARLADDAGAAR